MCVYVYMYIYMYVYVNYTRTSHVFMRVYTEPARGNSLPAVQMTCDAPCTVLAAAPAAWAQALPARVMQTACKRRSATSPP